MLFLKKDFLQFLFSQFIWNILTTVASHSKTTSSAMPSSSSAHNAPIPPPPTLPRRTEERSTPQNAIRSGAGIPLPADPVLISNNEIMSMFTVVKDQMKRQQEINQMLMKEI